MLVGASRMKFATGNTDKNRILISVSSVVKSFPDQA